MVAKIASGEIEDERELPNAAATLRRKGNGSRFLRQAMVARLRRD
jgi:hypothetical protein